MGGSPVVRISRGRFSPEVCETVTRLVGQSAGSLVPALKQLRGLRYYHAGVDRATSTVVNVSIWDDVPAAKQMETLAPMLAERPILEAAGVRFDPIANYESLWTIESKAGSA